MKKYTHEKAHEEIDYIFKTLLPQRGMAERPEQIRLCHSILDAMLDGSIALCDAGTGIGKTFAYLTAGILHGKCRAAEGKPQRPILISTSSIALQSAIQKEYLPLLSSVLLSEGLISAPIEAVIRKGKAHYACDARLERRVRQVEGSHKNPAARQALHTAWHVLDLDQLSGMSSYDRERICVPKRCNCRRKDCRYRCFLDACQSGQYTVQICNHNLLLADLIHRSQKKKSILPDSAAIIIDEAHKLPETARQMFGVSLLYSQVFQTLYYCADQIHHGPLPRHVHFILDEAPSVNLPGLPRELATMRSRNISCSTIIQNMAQIKEQFKDSWETIPGNSDTLLYLGGNESSTHKYISEALGKSTIDTKTHGETKGKSGSWSTNMQISGRELLTPDEVRRLDNRYAILLIRGTGPVMDLKYDLMKHPAVRQTSLAGGPPYIHHRQNQAPVISGHEFFAAFSTDDTNENKENAA